MLSRPTRCAMATACLASGLWTSVAKAQDAQQPDFTTGLWTRSTLLGDAGGVRSGLWNFGITFGLQDINEVWGNVTGGIQRGASYDGVTLMSIGLDTQRAFGWEGGTFNVSALEHPRPQHRHRQPAQPANPERHPCRGHHAAVGGLVPAVVPRRPRRREARPAEHRPGVHDQPGFQPVPQHRDGLADAPLGRPLRRRPSLSAVVARGAPAHAARPRHHHAARRVCRQPAGRPIQRRRTVARQHPLGRQLQPAHRRARDRRDPVRAEPARQRRRGPWRHGLRAAGHLQAGLLVRLRAVPRSAVRQHRPVARRSRQHRHCR